MVLWRHVSWQWFGGELKAILAYLCSIFAVPNLQGSRVFFAAINLPFTPLICHSAAWGLWVTSCSDISAGLNHAAEGHIPQPRQAPSSCGWGRDLPLRPADTRTGEAVWPRPAVLHLPAPHALLPQLASLLRLLQVVQGYAPPCRHIWRLLLQRYRHPCLPTHCSSTGLRQYSCLQPHRGAELRHHPCGGDTLDSKQLFLICRCQQRQWGGWPLRPGVTTQPPVLIHAFTCNKGKIHRVNANMVDLLVYLFIWGDHLLVTT